MELKVLASRNVEDSVGILFSEVCKRVQLVRRDAAERDLDALHSRSVPQRIRTFGHVACKVELLRANPVVAMAVVIALAIAAAAKARFGKNFLVQFSVSPQRHL